MWEQEVDPAKIFACVGKTHRMGASRGVTISDMEEVPMKVTVDGPELSGSYVVTEQRDDGTLVLEPECERLSEVIADTEGQVFRDEEFIAHPERVAVAKDDLPPDEGN